MGNCTGPKSQRIQEPFKRIGTNVVYQDKNEVTVSRANFVQQFEDLTIFTEKYALEESAIGSGAYGQVKKATLKSNDQQRAVKIIDKLMLSETNRERMKSEIDILKNLNHPNILNLYEVYENESSIYLVTELCDGRDLFEELSSREMFNEAEAAHVTK